MGKFRFRGQNWIIVILPQTILHSNLHDREYKCDSSLGALVDDGCPGKTHISVNISITHRT